MVLSFQSGGTDGSSGEVHSADFVMAVKAVFFDAAGTLIKPARRVGESYAVLAQKYGINTSATEIADAFRRFFSNAPPLAFPDANLSETDVLEREWWKTLVRNVFGSA